MAYTRNTDRNDILNVLKALEYQIQTGGAGYDDIVTVLETMFLIQSATDAYIRAEPIDTSGEKLTAAAANTDYQTTGALQAGGHFRITAEDGLFHVGYDTSTTASEVVMTIPAGVTVDFVWSSSVDLHYSSPTAGAVARLSQILT